MSTICQEEPAKLDSFVPGDHLLNAKDAAKLLSVSNSTFEAMLRQKGFPTPCRPTQNRRCWFWTDLMQWAREHQESNANLEN